MHVYHIYSKESYTYWKQLYGQPTTLKLWVDYLKQPPHQYIFFCLMIFAIIDTSFLCHVSDGLDIMIRIKPSINTRGHYNVGNNSLCHATTCQSRANIILLNLNFSCVVVVPAAPNLLYCWGGKQIRSPKAFLQLVGFNGLHVLSGFPTSIIN